MGFAIYDVETTGLNRRFDQILSFAVIRTDNDLEVVERHEFSSRLLPNIIPSPKALNVNGMAYHDLISESRPSHYAMVCDIHATLRHWTHTIFCGFNSIGFDEEFLRQAFYHCLQPIYLTNRNNNTRADVLKLVRAAAILHPGLLAIPVGADGRRMFNLNELAAANGLPVSKAHDAMSDAETALSICRRVRDGAPDLWSAFNRFSNRAAATQFVRDEPVFGVFHAFSGQTEVDLVTAVGVASDNSVHLCLDLTCDVDSLRALTVDQLVERLEAKPSPIRRVKVNAGPLLCHIWELEQVHLGGRTESDFVASAQEIAADQPFRQRLNEAYSRVEMVYPPSPHVEEQIYGGSFIPDEDWAVCAEFHAAPWEQRGAISQRLTDPRLRRLASRLFLFERPDLLNAEQRAQWTTELERRLCVEEDMPWLTIPAALREIEIMAADPMLEQTAIHQLRDVLAARLQRYQ